MSAALAPHESKPVGQRQPAKKTERPAAVERSPLPEREFMPRHGTALSRSFSEIPVFHRGDETTEAPENPILRQLKEGSSGDQSELEADRAARAVTGPRQANAEPPRIHDGSGAAAALTPAQFPKAEKVLASAGRSMEPELRRSMEHAFRLDFSKVRIHADRAAAESADELYARAYAAGSHLVFGDGQFAPSTPQGRTLVAHELTHVAQQSGGGPAIQRQHAPEKRPNLDVNAARAHGKAMAGRIKKHGKLSKEARAKIKRESAFFEGAAKDAYLEEVNPALMAVHEIEMPKAYLPPNLPKPRPLMESYDGPGACGGQDCFTDEQIYGQAKEEPEQDRRERERMLDELKSRMQGWRVEDQEFALDFLDSILRDDPHPDPVIVSIKIRNPLLARLKKELAETDQKRKEACDKDDRGIAQRSRDKFNNDDICDRWFKNESSHGPNTLAHLQRQLRIQEETGGTAVDHVYWDVYRYREISDPVMLEQEAIAGELVGGAVGLAGAFGEHFGGPRAVPGAGNEPGGAPPEPAPTRFTGPDPNAIEGGGETTAPRQGQFSVVDPDNTRRPVSPGKPAPEPTQPTPTPGGPTVANDNAPQQAQAKPLRKAAGGGGGGGNEAPGEMKMSKKPREPRPDFERGRQKPTAKEALDPRHTTSEDVEDLGRTSQNDEKVKKSRSKKKEPRQLDEQQQIIKAGKEIEPSNVQEWAKTQPHSASVYTNAEFPEDVRSIYPKVKGAATSGPDAISVNPGEGGKGEITVYDDTTKPTPEHAAKTKGDAQRLKDHLPERWKGYTVYYQEGWSDGGLRFSGKVKL